MRHAAATIGVVAALLLAPAAPAVAEQAAPAHSRVLGAATPSAAPTDTGKSEKSESSSGGWGLWGLAGLLGLLGLIPRKNKNAQPGAAHTATRRPDTGRGAHPDDGGTDTGTGTGQRP